MEIDREKLTPMMRQYFEVKDAYRDAILMYRLGDFYEMFFDDAVTASKVLELTLTGRNCGLEERAPMCGVPFHAVDGYLSKLVAAGYSVAICEQAEDPKDAAGLVKREVIRVVTPGTILEAEALEAGKNNYLCSVCTNSEGAGLAFADITTGECSICEFSAENGDTELIGEIVRYMPSEILLNLRTYENTELTKRITDKTGGVLRNYYDWAYGKEEAEKKINAQFTPEEADAAKRCPNASRALGALLLYLEETQKTKLTNLSHVEVNRDRENMFLDMYTLRNLEITETMRDRGSRGSLLHLLNRTKTAMGSRMMRKWITAPLKNGAMIRNRHIAVGELFAEPMLRAELAELLKQVSDMERLINRVVYKTAGCGDLTALKRSFAKIPELKNLLADSEASMLCNCQRRMDTLSDLRELIDTTIDEGAPATLRSGGLICKGANEELDAVREYRDNGHAKINEIVEKEKEKTGIKTMRLGFNKVFGYYIEVSKMQISSVPDYFIRKQTLAGGERYITPELKEVEEKVLEAGERSIEMEYELFCQVRDRVAQGLDRVLRTANAIAALDVLAAFAEVAEKQRYVMPEVNDGTEIRIKNGRHPVVEQQNRKTAFIPNDTVLDCRENQINIITGPNMAGKSTYMRQTALIVLMAQIGSFVPAEDATIGIVDRIFTRVGASDDLSSGQSTFMVEMNEVAYILNHATDKSLIILDEVGRGTSTYDGLGIAWAVVEYLADRKKCGAKTMFATHYHELTQLEGKIPNVKNYCVAVKKHGDTISFLRKIIRGGADESYGVEVAALAGVKKSVIRRAGEIVAALERKEPQSVREEAVRTRVEAQRDTEQMNFFAAAENPIIAELKEIDCNALSPMEALTKLYALQAKAKNEA